MVRIANDNPLDEEVTFDLIQPFQLESSGLRGRIVKLGSVLDEICGAHEYPYLVSLLVAETVTATLLLSSMLKYEGIFTLQLSGDGPIKAVLCDVTSQGHIRAYATFDAEKVSGLEETLSEKLQTGPYDGFDIGQLVGAGYIAFTVDQEGKQDRYQGIVELKGANLRDCIDNYFRQSEQILTTLEMASAYDPETKKWLSGGIMLQRLPEDDRFTSDQDVVSIVDSGRVVRDEDWNRSAILMESVKVAELIDAELDVKELLVRLFHEEGIRIFDETRVKAECRCSEDRVKNVLDTLPKEDLEHIAKEGIIEIKCEFCSKKYSFPLAKIDY